MSEWEAVYDDEVDIQADEAANAPVFVAKLVEIGLMMRNGRRQLHVAWEPLSFRQVFNKAAFLDKAGNPFRTDDYSHDWLISHTSDGRLMGSTTQFGIVREAFSQLGFPLTKNESFRSILIGKVFKVTRVRELYSSREDLNTAAMASNNKAFESLTQDEQRAVRVAAVKSKTSFCIKPVEELESYTPPTDLKVVRYGFKDVFEVKKATAEQNAALISVLNNKHVDKFIDAIMDSGNGIIICDPFMTEAVNGNLMVERLVALGGKLSKGVVSFE